MASALAACAATWAVFSSVGLNASVCAAIALVSGCIALMAARLASARVVVRLSREQLIVKTRRLLREEIRVLPAAEVSGVSVRNALLPQLGLYAGLQLVWIVCATSSASPDRIELWLDDDEDRARARADSIAHTLQLRGPDVGGPVRTVREPLRVPSTAQTFTIRTRTIRDSFLRIAAAGTVGGLVFLGIILRNGTDDVGLAAIFGTLISTGLVVAVVAKFLATGDERLTVRSEHIEVEQTGRAKWFVPIDGNLSFRRLAWMEDQGPGIRIRTIQETRVVGARVGKRQLNDLVRWLESSTGIAVLGPDQ